MASMSMSIGDIHAAHGSTVIAGSNHVASCEHAKDDLTRCVDALFITDPYIDKQEILDSTGGLVEGTCEWIRSEDKYRAWLESEESELLCISGGPGMGKTMLSIFLIGEFQGLTQSSSGNLVYHFCNRHDPRRDTATSVLRTWLHDIFTGNPSLAKHAAKSMTCKGRMEYALASLGTLWQIFTDTLNDPDLGPLYCVLDGLDECPEGDKKWLLGKIQTLFENRLLSPNILKVVILSGSIEGVRGSHYLNLDQCSGRWLRALNPGLDYIPEYSDERRDDVWLVIKARLENHPRVEEFDESFWNGLGRELYRLSEGLFSWAGFMLDEIASKKSESEMWKTLKKAPRGLRPVYPRLFSQIGDKSRLEIAEMVRWMALAQEPFTAQQLSHALYPDKKHRNESDEAVARIEDLVTDSYPLMRFTRSYGDVEYVTYDNGNYVVLYHRSLADYLLEIDINNADVDPKIKAFHITPEKAHYKIAKRCLDDLNVQYNRPEEIGQGMVYYWDDCKFNATMWLNYAKIHWPTHAKLCGEESLKFMKPKRHAFFEEISILRTAWWLEYDPNGIMKDHMRRAMKRKCSMFGALQTCAALDLLPLIRTLLEEHPGDDLCIEYANDFGTDSHTAIAYATQYNKSEAAELLVRSGASLVSSGQERIPYLTVECPLVNTFKNGKERLARLFLDLACAEMKDSEHDKRVTTFNLICVAQSGEFVMMVLRAMNIEDINVEFGNIVSEALGWFPQQVEKLKWLCHRVRSYESSHCKVWREDDTKYEPFLNVVYFVLIYPDVAENPVTIVRKFLLDGVDVNGASSCGWTALHLVVALGRDHWWAVELTQALLAHGALVNAVIKKGRLCRCRFCKLLDSHSRRLQTAVDLASRRGDSPRVLSLLKKSGGIFSNRQQKLLAPSASKRKRRRGDDKR